jgi:uncharacterized protein (TIGR03067 family)
MRISPRIAVLVGVCLAGVLFLPVVSGAEGQASPKEAKNLDGTWEVLTLVSNGNQVKEELTETRTVVIKGNRLIADSKELATISLDADRKPGAIEIVMTAGPVRGQVQKGVYKLEGDILKLCFADLEATAKAMFREYDKNGDGVLGAEEMPETLRLELAKWDANKDGLIDFGEFKAYLQARMQQSFKDFDSPPDSGVTLLIYKRVKVAAPAAEPSAPEKGPAAAKWEYQVLTRAQVADLGKKDVGAGLNKLGSEGWELVTVEPGSRSEGRGGSSAGCTTFYLKRPVARPDTSAAQGKGELKAFRLKHVDVTKTAAILQQLLGDRKGVRIIADESSKQILVQAPVDDIIEVAKILNLLDTPPEK